MKLTSFITLFMLASVCIFAGDQDFTLVNETGLTIDQFYCSPNTSDKWEEDVLGVDVLENEQEVEITFSRDEESCEWDLMIVDEDGDKIYWTGIDLCETAVITLYYEDGKPTALLEEATEEDEYEEEYEEDEEDSDY